MNLPAYTEEERAAQRDELKRTLGDCYISGVSHRKITIVGFAYSYCLFEGFIKGGELHGIISIKVTDRSQVQSTTSRFASVT